MINTTTNKKQVEAPFVEKTDSEVAELFHTAVDNLEELAHWAVNDKLTIPAKEELKKALWVIYNAKHIDGLGAE